MGQATLSASASVAINGNPKRVAISITNLDSTDAAYLSPVATQPNKVTTANASIIIPAGGSFSLNVAQNGAVITQSDFWAIASAGTPTIAWLEMF